MENTIWDEFINLGYIIQKPNKDKQYFLVKQFSNYSKFIFITRNKKSVKVECKILKNTNYTDSYIDVKEGNLLINLFDDIWNIKDYEFLMIE